MHPDDDAKAMLDRARNVIDDPAVEVAFAERNVRPRAAGQPLDSDGSRRSKRP